MIYTDDDTEAYFEAIAVDDEIAVSASASFGPRPVRTLKVDKVTKTQIIAGGYRFRRCDGHQVGDYHGARIALPEDAARMRAEWRRYSVEHALRVHGCKMEIAEIERMAGVLAEARAILEAEKVRADA